MPGNGKGPEIRIVILLACPGMAGLSVTIFLRRKDWTG
jgi:hypothetical protein